MTKPTTIDQYITTFPADVQPKLEQLRATIKAAAPQAEEVISYSVPAFRLGGMLVWFAAHTHHIGLYPRGSAIEAFANDLTHYKCTKGTVQFPLSEPLPLELITRMVNFRVAENMQRLKAKKQ